MFERDRAADGRTRAQSLTYDPIFNPAGDQSMLHRAYMHARVEDLWAFGGPTVVLVYASERTETKTSISFSNAHAQARLL